MSSTQFAVLQSDASSGGHRNPSAEAGESTEAAQSSCLLFDTFDEAVD
jgi:hypothetical protein